MQSKDPTHTINNVDKGTTHTRALIPDIPFHPGPIYRPPPKPIRSNVPRSQESSQSLLSVENINPDINLDFEENSPFQEGIISENFQRPNKSFQTSYIILGPIKKGCYICLLVHNEKLPVRQFQTRINPNYIPLSRLSMDLKVMPRSYKGHKFILCIIDEVTNYLITVPIYQAMSEEIGEAPTENMIKNIALQNISLWIRTVHLCIQL